MEPPPEEMPPIAPAPDPGRVHGRIALTILGIVGGSCLVLLALAHSRGFEAGMREIRREEARRTKFIVLPAGHIADDADRVLNEEIPSTDHRKGGVYLFGTSTFLWAFDTWGLPEAERRLIHNDSITASGHVGQSLLIRYLVEREGLLEAGPDKTLVVFGTGYQNVGFVEDANSALSQTLARRGFYVRGEGGSIGRSDLGTPARVFSIERARLYGMVNGLFKLANTMIRDRIGRSRSRTIDPKANNRIRAGLLGADWREKIDRELASLKGSIDDLRSRKVPILVVLMPQGTWEDALPFDRYYNDHLLEICRERGLKTLDLRKLADDEDFADSSHLAPTGVDKCQQAILPACLEHLRSHGLLPDDAAGGPR